MSHLFEQGFFVRQPAWHGLGTVIADYPGKAEAMRLAGHDHKVGEIPLFTAAQADGQSATYSPLTGWKGLAREDTKQIIAVMKDSYSVIQNDVPWDLIDSLFAAGAKWDTAGILKGRYDECNTEVKGQVYWCLALLDEPQTVKGDNTPVYPYIAATWSHDGSQSVRIRAMHVRIVCANTHHAAMYSGDGQDFDLSMRHIGDVNKRREIVAQSLRRVRDASAAFLEVANELAAIPTTDAQILQFCETIIPLPLEIVGGALVTDRVKDNVKKARGQLLGLFNGQTIAPGIRNTAYGMVEAGVEYLDHLRKHLSSDSYFTRNVMATHKAKAELINTVKSIVAA